MKIIDRLTGAVAPVWTMKRVAARAQIERLYDAAQSHHQHYRPTTSGRRSGDGVMEHARDKVTLWARHLDENHDLVTGLLSTLANTVSQIQIEPMVRRAGGELATVTNDQLSDLFRRWKDEADSTGTLPWSDLCHVAARTWFRDGEVLVNHLEGQGGPVLPYSIELLEPDFLPWDLTRSSGPIIVHGVEKNARGRAVAYWFYREHPGNNDTIIRLRVPSLQDLTRVPVEQCSHVKLVKRLHQTRGVSILHPVVHRLDDIRDYEESERISARVAASISAFIKTSPQWGQSVELNSVSGEQPFEMDSGQVHRLAAGEEIVVPNNPRPNSELSNFRRSQLRAVSAGTGVRYSKLARDYSDGSYSSQRQELVEGRADDTNYRDSWNAQFLRPVWRRFVRMALLAGKVTDVGVNPETLFEYEYAGASIPWIDVQKEVGADSEAVREGFKSRQQVVREHGGSLREIDRERAQDTQPGATPLEVVGNGNDQADTDDDTATA